jgi:16S rRNA pseudouridine516 synthase
MTPAPHGNHMRLDRFLSHSSGLSRSQVKRLLHADGVTLDGLPVRDPALAVGEHSLVTLNGATQPWPRSRYVMLNKPAGYVCSTEDPGHPVVSSLVDAPWAAGLHSAGRLDVDSTGLVLLTNDGAWSHALTSPRRHCLKTYLVGLKHPVAADVAQRFADGLLLNGENRPTLPAQLELIDTRTARVSIQEGRYHQVKRMFAACSNRVETLHRERIGAILLDPALQPGQWRELQAIEIGSIPHE